MSRSHSCSRFEPPEEAPGRTRHQERDARPDLLAAGEVHPRLVPGQAGPAPARPGLRHLAVHRLPVQGRGRVLVLEAQALEKAAEQGLPYAILDGTLISSDRFPDKKTSRKGTEIDRSYSGKAHEHADLVQVIISPDGAPPWASEVRPGSTHDITAARELVLPGLRPWLKVFPCLGDSGYEGAGTGVLVPVRKPREGDLDTDAKCRSMLLRGLRYQGERGFALLKERWRALQHVTVSPDPDRRHRESRTRPHANRAQDDHLKVAGKTSLKIFPDAGVTAFPSGRSPRGTRTEGNGILCNRSGSDSVL